MKLLKSSLVIFSSVGLMFLGACSNQTPASNLNTSPATTTSATANPVTSASDTAAKLDHSKPAKGGQVVESGAYHLEFVPLNEANGTHLDFYLLRGDNHEAVPNAKVTAQVQLPDGTEKTLPLTYDADGKHYAALLPGKIPGQYQVRITSDINGEKVNGRFNFKQ